MATWISKRSTFLPDENRFFDKITICHKRFLTVRRKLITRRNKWTWSFIPLFFSRMTRDLFPFIFAKLTELDLFAPISWYHRDLILFFLSSDFNYIFLAQIPCDKIRFISWFSSRQLKWTKTWNFINYKFIHHWPEMKSKRVQDSNPIYEIIYHVSNNYSI